ncbi:HPr-rel-A system PqqD family peptide chaperone [Sphingopyxis sp. BSN-002]|uniref:HPr-rel-A system PqqD family peptide chaperone n=1 Tax=Sphingopyxis sp. BSN-002 TaxID=2911495 RepID=UPI001EDB782E|nr:HPr-rel-A system PqqD family peptide chaperone [Sphingopyxis sp. BSN-002]UKK84611.1 HPr-rel-A system PqqD family peptide chaperone [Sphingopyxis sp. BSN-002]
MADHGYRAAPADALRIEALGELTAIFDRRSMQTHLVISPMPEILASMDDGIHTAATIAGRLAADFDLDAEGDAGLVIAERLAELAAMGLVAGA